MSIDTELLLIGDKILEIVDNADDFDRSDLQGCIEAQVRIAYLTGKAESTKEALDIVKGDK